ncbi:MAG: helix-turn-helix transcriptional regulator [Leptolyngbyaceae cyanobacterium bins.302]|nr:helix-turn-helix transcriptional regulator [Leptolyngbyaceae cyanobacterium bins.302]
MGALFCSIFRFYRSVMRGGSKYQPLQDFLMRSERSPVTLSFAEIEALLHTPLPASARTNRAWWSNRSKGALQSAAWIQAGYTVRDLDLEAEQVTFHKPPDVYKVQQVDNVVQWNGELVRALRQHMGMTQAELAEELGVRQQTVSEWEKGVYAPTRASSKYLMLVAEKAKFNYEVSTD